MLGSLLIDRIVLKRTKAWSDAWLPKLREDQRRCGADVALIISQALPKHIEHFDLVDNVWVAHPRCALPVAVALRQSLIELSNSRFVQQGQETKMEQVYKYLTGMKFRQRVEAVIEKFDDMREDLERERKFVSKQWSKREAQILLYGRNGGRPAGHRRQGYARDSQPRHATARGVNPPGSDGIVISQRRGGISPLSWCRTKS